MKPYYLILTFIFLITSLSTRGNETLTFTRGEIEALFLQQNLDLLAEKMNVDIADAAIPQARLWENPELSISDLNLWSTRSGRQEATIPPLFGSFGKNTEFSIELSQLIQTANKRGKLVHMEKVSKEIALAQFEEILRGLKAELRAAVDEILYIQAYRQVIAGQIASLTRLTEAYARQVQQGNLAKSELLRLQSALFEAENEEIEIETQWNALQKEMRILLNLPPGITITLAEEQKEYKDPGTLTLSTLTTLAMQYRADLKMAGLQIGYMEKSLALERARRVPDITLSAGYDRYGGVWKDFIGFGVSMDLPLLNRNQGSIKAARIQLEQSRFENRKQENLAYNEIAEALSNYTLAYNFYHRTTGNPLFEELDEMLDIYTRNLLERNISMLEYIDFTETYKSNKEALLSARKNLAGGLEELQYVVGTDIK